MSPFTPTRSKWWTAPTRPILSNYTTFNVAPGLVYRLRISPSECGYSADANGADKATQPTLDGKLAVRVALPLDAVVRLHQQLQQMLIGLRGMQAPQKAEPKGQA